MRIWCFTWRQKSKIDQSTPKNSENVRLVYTAMTKRPHRSADGAYHINGKKFKELFGSRQQVMNGTAYKTAGELTKSHLMMNKWGRIVSRKKHATAKKEKRLMKHGYTAKKGKFGYVKMGSKKSRKSRKKRGGSKDDDGDDDDDDQQGGALLPLGSSAYSK